VAEHLALGEAEQVLCGQIEIGDDELLVEGDDGDAEPAENPVGAGRFAAALTGRPGRRGRGG